jgi:hypothetical protein
MQLNSTKSKTMAELDAITNLMYDGFSRIVTESRGSLFYVVSTYHVLRILRKRA